LLQLSICGVFARDKLSFFSEKLKFLLQLCCFLLKKNLVLGPAGRLSSTPTSTIDPRPTRLDSTPTSTIDRLDSTPTSTIDPRPTDVDHRPDSTRRSRPTIDPRVGDGDLDSSTSTSRHLCDTSTRRRITRVRKRGEIKGVAAEREIRNRGDKRNAKWRGRGSRGGVVGGEERRD